MSTTLARPACAAVLLTCLTAGPALAQQTFDKHTLFTFSGPVAIPGVTLPAGQYVFRVADVPSRSVIQVQSPDGAKSYAMLLYIRAERLEPPVAPEVRFMETPAGTTPAIKTMWYPGNRAGWEFVYPKAQARLLAAGTGQPVLTTREEAPPATPAPELARIAPSGETTPVASVPPSAPVGRVLQGEVIYEPAPEALEARASLPKTASATWLVAAAGVLFLVGAALIRRRRAGLA
jgi:LPXTG-motif cell wall-anchored protein